MPALPPWPLVLASVLVRVLLAFLLLFVTFPALIWPHYPGRMLERVGGRFLIMIFTVIALAHFLALSRLYEGISVIVLIVGALFWRIYLSQEPGTRAEMIRSAALRGMAWLDRMTGARSPRAAAAEAQVITAEAKPSAESRWEPLLKGWWESIPLVAVLAVAFWQRFHMAFLHAGPAFSDAPATLKWMKMFGGGALYPDGVYPQGMYAFLSLMRKLTLMDPLVIMEVTGPLMACLIVVSVAGFVYGCTGSKLAAAVGAMFYGTLPTLTPIEFGRQSGYNSQEFALVFVLPAAWFIYRYLADGDRWHGLTGAAGAGIVAFTHVIAVMADAGFMLAALAAALMQRAVTRERLLRIAGWGLAAGFLAGLPLVIGQFLLKREVHQSSASFLADLGPSSPFVPALWVTFLPVVALGGLILGGERRDRLRFGIMATFAGVLMWLFPFALPPGLGRALGYRTGEIGALALSVGGGLAWWTLELLIQRLATIRAVPALLCAGMIAAAWLAYPPQPAVAVRPYPDEVIEQVLRIDRNLPQGDWMLVMEEPGHALAVGRGEHQMPSDFLARAQIGADGWCMSNPQTGELVPQPHHIALFVDRRLASYSSLSDWVRQYSGRIPLTRIYESPDLEVWLVRYPEDPKETKDRAWGIAQAGCRIERVTPLP